MGSYDLTHRPRRLRTSPVMRDMVAETVVSPSDLILPVFVRENASENTPIASMPGVERLSVDLLLGVAKEAVALGIPMLAADAGAADAAVASKADKAEAKADKAAKQPQSQPQQPPLAS